MKTWNSTPVLLSGMLVAEEEQVNTVLSLQQLLLNGMLLGLSLVIVASLLAVAIVGFIGSLSESEEKIPDQDQQEGRKTSTRDRVDVASEDSFPASDAPAWTSVTAIGSPASVTSK